MTTCKELTPTIEVQWTVGGSQSRDKSILLRILFEDDDNIDRFSESTQS